MSGGTYRSFKTSKKWEQDGIILDLGSAGKFTLARAGGSNLQFARDFKRITSPHRRAIETKTIDDETATRLLIEAYASSVVLGWKGVTDEAGNEMKFSKQNAIKLFTELPELFNAIRAHAEDAQLYREAELEEEAKNSERSSGTL